MMAKATAKPLPIKIRPYESWIVSLAAMAAIVLLSGLLTSAFFGIQSINSISRLAHSDDIENALEEYQESIKQIHTLQQELIIERLKPMVIPVVEQRALKLTQPHVQKWLQAAGMENQAIAVNQLSPLIDDDARATPLKWIGRNKLRILNYTLEFPKGALYNAFRTANDLRQRYQLVGVKLDTEIQPTLLRSYGLILIACFVLLSGIFLLYSRRFKNRIEEMIAGFLKWSDEDTGFRFIPKLWKGELKLITSQFNAMADDVEANRKKTLYLEKIASWQIIARKLAHEIKNPLTPIQMMVSQLNRRYRGSDEDFKKLLNNAQNIISEEVAGLRRMVDDFSNFARLPSANLKDSDLIQVCRKVVELQQAAFEQHKISFTSGMQNASAHADDDLLRQVILNLIKNAAEASGEKPAEIIVSVEDRRSEFVISVHDNGPGVPKDLQDRIFEAYFTTKHTGPTAGMGLGLAICQKIILDHGGRLSVESEPGDTHFYIHLPKEVESSPIASVSKGSRRGKSGEKP